MRALLPSLLLLLGTSLPAYGYQLKQDSSGHPVRFPAGVVRFVISDELPAGVSRSQLKDALERAARSWSAYTPGVELVIDEKEALEEQPGYHSDGQANENGIYFASHSWPYDPKLVAIALLTVDPVRHEILDADIVFNTASHRFAMLPATSAPGGGTADDWESTAAHELGHAIGLAHNPELPDATMFPGSRPGEIIKRTLKTDDQAGALALYSEPPESAPETPLAVGCQTGAGASAASALSLLFLGLRSGNGWPRAGRRGRPRPPHRPPSP